MDDKKLLMTRQEAELYLKSFSQMEVKMTSAGMAAHDAVLAHSAPQWCWDMDTAPKHKLVAIWDGVVVSYEANYGEHDGCWRDSQSFIIIPLAWHPLPEAPEAK